MDAKTFISKKYEAAMEELKALEADYKIRKETAQATIDMAKKWMAELEDVTTTEPRVSLQEFTKTTSNNWVSARDLTPQARHISG